MRSRCPGCTTTFAPAIRGKSFAHAIAVHERNIGSILNLKPGMKVLDVGCGIGGPQRTIAKATGANIVGLNINEYQLEKCERYNSKTELEVQCTTLHGDFMNIPVQDNRFDAAYQIEGTAHATDKRACYAEILRVLKPGAWFAGYEYAMTPKYNPADPGHMALKKKVLENNSLADVVSFERIDRGLIQAGFDDIETRDLSLETEPGLEWYRALDGGSLNLRSLPRTAVGRAITARVVKLLEVFRIVPRGTLDVALLLNQGADSLADAGRLGIFTPMYLHKARKPE